MDHLESAVARFTRRQNGVLSREQALTAGLSSGAIARRVRESAWLRPFPNVYADVSTGRSWLQDLTAAYLWAGPDAAISHRSAAALWKFEGISDAAMELTTPRRLTHPDVIIHHRTLGPRDSGMRGPIRATSPTRTLLDLCTVINDRAVARALDDALRRRITTLDKIERLLHRVSGRGARGCSTLRRLAKDRIDIGVTESELESQVLQLLRAEGFPTPNLQYEIRDQGQFLARVDFAYPEARVAIEVGSFTYHSAPKDWEHDHSRHNHISSRGWTVLYITRAQLRGALRCKFVDELRIAMGSSSQQKLA